MAAKGQYITFNAPGVGTTRALMQDTPPKLEEGNPVWDQVARPHLPALTLWRGRNPYQMTVPVIFWSDGDSVESDINTLDRMRRSPSSGVQPPAVTVSGAIPRRDISNWVIMSIDYGDNVLYDVEHGIPVRTKQDVTVVLLERVDETRVTHAVVGPRHPFHVVKSGESLVDISRAEYGDAKHMAAIRKANGLTDSRNPPKGKRLRMPSG